MNKVRALKLSDGEWCYEDRFFRVEVINFLRNLNFTRRHVNMRLFLKDYFLTLFSSDIDLLGGGDVRIVWRGATESFLNC